MWFYSIQTVYLDLVQYYLASTSRGVSSEWKSISRLYFLFAKPTSFVIYRIIDSFYILNTWNSEVSRKTRHPYLTIIAIRANRHYRIFESWGNTFSLSAMQNICLSIYISRYCSFSQRILRISGRILGRIVSTKGRTRSGYTSSTSIYLSICSKNTTQIWNLKLRCWNKSKEEGSYISYRAARAYVLLSKLVHSSA